MLIYDLSLEELENYLISGGYKKYRALQVYEWLYKKNVSSFTEMANLPKDLIQFLSDNFVLLGLETVKSEQSDDKTIKLLYRLKDGNIIETVLMEHHYGLSLCVTTQVGCNMGCIFCASGQLKKVRNLSSGEIILQILETERITKKKINYIVVMGIGEPFDNYENVTKFLLNANHKNGLQIGARHITISTCGIIPKIKEFSDFPLQVNLAISLHSGNDIKRSKLMPINKRYKLDDLLLAVKEYILKTKRRVTIEYILINNYNDSTDDAKELASRLRGLNVYVNLIPYNEVEGVSLSRSSIENRNRFYDLLKKNGINVTLRRETGSDINAACGQLRSKEVKNNGETE